LPVSFLNEFHVFEFIDQHRPKQANAAYDTKSETSAVLKNNQIGGKKLNVK